MSAASKYAGIGLPPEKIASLEACDRAQAAWWDEERKLGWCEGIDPFALRIAFNAGWHYCSGHAVPELYNACLMAREAIAHEPFFDTDPALQDVLQAVTAAIAKASAGEASGQDAKRLDAQHEHAAPEGGDAQ